MGRADVTLSHQAAKRPGRCYQRCRQSCARAFPTSDDRRQQFQQYERSSAPPPPPPPPPPPFADGLGVGPRQGSFESERDNGGQAIIGAGIAALVALGFVYGFRDDDTAALRAARSLPPTQTISQSITDPQTALMPQQAPFPSTVLPGEVPIGLQGQWEHKWRYDANGQPFLQLKGRWWRLERPAGARQLVTFYDTQNQLRPGLAYIYTPPPEWPVDEVDLTNQVTMALLFGQEARLEDRLQLVE